MARLKTFFKYGIWILVFFIFSQIMIYVAINTTYKYKNIDIETSLIKDAQVEATSINGIAKCKVSNTTQSEIIDKYIKIECYSKNNVLMGTKYLKIDKISTNEEQEFEIRFNYSRVDKAKIYIVDNIDENVTEEQKISDPEMNAAMVISALIMLFTFA